MCDIYPWEEKDADLNSDIKKLTTLILITKKTKI